ncbi:MAG TPA: glycyl radical protein [Candidatus Baltobacteraceae bacterium]|nr:glycyl radical protein [Candidatus Baltobacteraceae bacterium]
MTARTERLREDLLTIVPTVCPDRATLLTASWQDTEGEPILIRRALGLAHILRGMRIWIRPGELVVGNQASAPRAAPLFPEYAVRWLRDELDALPTRPTDQFQISGQTAAAVRQVCDYWAGRTHQDRVQAVTRRSLPPTLATAFDFRLSSLNQVINNLGRQSTGDGHVIVNHEQVLRTGFRGLIAEARRCADGLDMADPDSVGRRLFYQAVEISLEAGIAFAERFATLAEEQARTEVDPARQSELMTIAATCRRVPAEPARTFREAIQASWFIQLLVQIESNGHSIGPGRLDQFLFPYYAADLAVGRLTREQALELVECYWLKCSELNKVREWAYTEFMSGYPLFQTVTLGGQTRDGRDAVNDLTSVCLEATANLKLVQPTVVVRVHSGSSDEHLLEAARCLVRHGGGMPGFFNDEVGIPLLLRLGVSLEDARDWSVMGCSEPQVAGQFNTGTGGGSHINLLKVLEIALNGGTNPNTGLAPWPEDRDLRSFRSFDELWGVFRRQLSQYLSILPVLDNITSHAYADLTPTPFLSAMVNHRLAVGKDISQGGPPNHHSIVQHGYGLANVANGLAAVRRLVFDEQKLTGSELASALASNFAGPHGEEIRQLLLNRAPKFGNDDDAVDALARDVASAYVSEVAKYRPLRGGVVGPSTQSLTANVPAGAKVGATPDGRRTGEPLADNNSPTAGTDLGGPTAVLKSVAKLDHTLISNGTILNLKFHPSALAGEGRLRKFVAMIRSFFDLKGFQVQFNVISADMLREAQAHPEQYRNLVVKVAGYSALFSSLDRKLQDQLIARTAHDIR